MSDMEIDFAAILLEVIERNASDLHLTAGARPTVRMRGALVALEDFPVLKPIDTRELIYSILTSDQRQRWRPTGSSTSPTPSPVTAASASTPTSSAAR